MQPKYVNLTDKPTDYSTDNGHGQPTHLLFKHFGRWVKTPEGYCRRPDGIISHKYLKDEDGEYEWISVPSTKEIEAWVYDSVCETPWGDIVEPDHPKSWLRILGLI
jgi:hypothetical protein